MTKGLVSIVVPIYKAENYLNRCVESIVNQTYTNLEIILVDDGSPDNCPQICDQWAEKDSRVKVIHQDNGGLSSARNQGMSIATGEYICFFDSDDYVDLNTIRHAYDLVEKHQAEVVVYGYHNVNSNGEIVGTRIPRGEQEAYAGEAVQEEFLPEIVARDPRTGVGMGAVLSAWSMMASLELIRRENWSFVSEREILSEDVYSLLALYKYVNKVAILSEALYYYCENLSSVSRIYRPDRYARSVDCYLKCLELCEKNGYSAEVKRRCATPFVANVFATMKQTVTCFEDKAKAVAELKPMVDDPVLQRVLREKKGDKEPLKKKVFYWAIRKNRYAFVRFLLSARLNR